MDFIGTHVLIAKPRLDLVPIPKTLILAPPWERIFLVAFPMPLQCKYIPSIIIRFFGGTPHAALNLGSRLGLAYYLAVTVRTFYSLKRLQRLHFGTPQHEAVMLAE